MASGVFGLKKVYKKQVENVDQDTFTYWPEGATRAYATGSGARSPYSGASKVYRIDLASDVIDEMANSPNQNGGGVSGFSNRTHGYWGGGNLGNPTARSEILRLDFASEVMSLPGTNLPGSNFNAAQMQTSEYGYGVGGNTGIAYKSIIFRVDFNTETSTDITETMPDYYHDGSATQSDSYGYVVGGRIGTSNSTGIRRFDFTSETLSLIPAVTEEESRIFGITENSHSAIMQRGLFNARTSNLSKLEFSSETVRTHTAQTTEAMEGSLAYSNTDSGYFSAGYSPVSVLGTSVYDSRDKIDFANDTKTALPSFPVSKAGLGGFTNRGTVTRRRIPKTIGFFMGGYDGANSSYVKRMDFTSDTSSTPSMRISHATTGMRGVANNNFGYAMGGFHGQGSNPPPDASHRESRLHRIDFATENLTVLSATPQAHTNFTTLWSVDDMYAWKAGDQFNSPPSPVGSRSDIRRLDYSTESWNVPGQIQPTRQAKGLIFSDIKNRNGISISGSGNTPTVNYNPTTFIKYQTDNDTITGTPFPALGSHQNAGASIYNPQYGYYSGGTTAGLPIQAYSDVYRLDLSSDTYSDTTANSHPQLNSTGVSSNHYGYFCQGQPNSPPPFALATITKFDYSTETASPVPDMNGGGDYNLGSMPNGI